MFNDLREVQAHMKRIALLAIVALALAPAAFAADYHEGATLICSDCHVMHYSQSHGYNDNGGGIYGPIGNDGPYHYLLRNEINDLCLGCHDGSTFAPDVLEQNGGVAAVRLAGALNRDGVAPYYHATGHTLDSTDPAPGGTFVNADGLNCVDCHYQHGRYNAYRLMRGPSSSTVVSYAVGTNDVTKDAYEITAGGATHYDWSNVFFNEPGATYSHYADHCKRCHTNFHGLKGGPEVGGATGQEWLRHPNADADIGALTGGHSSLTTYNSRVNKVKVMSPTGVWNPAPTGVTPSCFSCHKAHGNQNSFGLIHMSGTGTITEEGDDGTMIKQLCKQCHVQG